MSVPIIPESAPFTPSQRAWLNGFFAGLLNIDPRAAAQTDAPADPAAAAPAPDTAAADDIDPDDPPWHDSTLSLDERLEIAGERPLDDRLMAAMAQLDCGACGYLCRTYSKAIADGSETDLTRCVPGGKQTAKTLKKLVKLNVSAGSGEPATAPASAGGNGSVAVRQKHSGGESAHGRISVADSPPLSYDRGNPFPAPVLAVKKLNGEGSAKDTRFVAFDLEGSGLTYRTGDALGVYPENCFEQVRSLVRQTGLTGGETVDIDGKPVSLSEAFVRHCDIVTPSDELIEALISAAGDDAERGHLGELLEDNEVPGLVEEPRIIDILARFRSARLDAQTLVSCMDRLQPRLYSISSSPSLFPGEVHLTVGVVRYEMDGQSRKGVASTFLAERVLTQQPVRIFVQPAHAFAPPTDPDAPMIMVGPGTGIAPFRAFLQEREAAGAGGRNWLFFGDQREATDYLYRDEFNAWHDRGLLTRIDTAFSRDQQEKVYVQHRLLEHGDEVWAWLQDGAHFYVCGDATRMAKDVDDALLQVIQRHGGLTDDRAKQFVKQLVDTDRYQRDVY